MSDNCQSLCFDLGNPQKSTLIHTSSTLDWQELKILSSARELLEKGEVALVGVGEGGGGG